MKAKWTVLLLLPALLLSACGKESTETSNSSAGEKAGTVQAAPKDTLSKLREQGYATVGFANENPYAFKTAEGELTGEAVEIAKVVLDRLGIHEIRGELTEFSSLIAGLQANRFDLITAGMFINPDRCKAVLFADPEYSIGEGLAVKEGNPLKLNSYKSIASTSEAKVAVMAGAIEIGYLQASGVTEKQMVIVPDQDAAISALQSGRADAITMTGPALQSRLDGAADSKLERVMNFEQPVVDGKSVRGYGATAFRLEDTSFRDAFNAELDKMKASGELLEILKKFGFTEQELPQEMTSAELCAG
ncbi:ectoine/hydroxyectoine ABC transporter substrate-binding protein EhuB [Paenibacillus silvisoli]|uniref:ectoine/hydroxyectoine ABC transporter substrate-binding protein EhuB n=1 Tax=Paenibacillus silvisoli TaxID=3110539 RepID=UPI0028063D04|nr:ectoine/hydroxyectoine ABC transporter substrate-binding protein EhuB [Paenibacillus silvisoli]